MKSKEMNSIAQGSSSFGEVLNKTKSMEVAVFVWTKVKSQSEYSIPLCATK